MFNKNFLLLFCIGIFSINLSADELVNRFNIQDTKICKSKFGNKVAYSTCLDSVLSDKIRELNTWQKSINLKLQEIASFNGRRDTMVLFKKSSRMFEKFKESNCKWQYLSLLPDIYAAGNMSKECHIFMTVKRIHELKQLNDFEFY